MGNDSLIYAAAGNHPHTCNELLVYRPDVTHSNEDGETAFTIAVRNNSYLGEDWDGMGTLGNDDQCRIWTKNINSISLSCSSIRPRELSDGRDDVLRRTRCGIGLLLSKRKKPIEHGRRSSKYLLSIKCDCCLTVVGWNQSDWIELNAVPNVVGGCIEINCLIDYIADQRLFVPTCM